MVIARARSDETYLRRLVESPRDVLTAEGYPVPDDIELLMLVDQPGIIHVGVTRQTSEVEDLARILAPRFPIPEGHQIRLVQSSEQLRYLVIPQKPQGLGARIEAEIALLNCKPDDTGEVVFVSKAETQAEIETQAETEIQVTSVVAE